MQSGAMVLVLCLATVMPASAAAQQQNPPASQIPDAPSATKEKNSPFPAGTAPAPANPTPQSQPAPEEQQPENPAPQQPSPPPEVKTVPPGSANRSPDENDTPYTIPVSVNFVTLPVTVKDDNGKLVEGLLRKDFSIYEDGVQQRISYFTSDPFALSTAVVVDRSLPAVEMKKVNQSLPALAGAFSPYDEVAVYTYGNSVKQVRDFGAANDRFDQTLSKLKSDLNAGRHGGVPVVGTSPMTSGPSINGLPVNPNTPQVQSYRPESHALNDAILRAALDLVAHKKALPDRGRGRRLVVFVISNGEERDSNASYSEVMKVLLSNGIIVYSVGVGTAAIPGYKTLSQINLPGVGTMNILPKYVSATGGENFAEFSRSAIEQAYAKVTEVARNQYTLGYTTRATAASNYRTIEVRVKRPGLKVYAKDGYFPLPPERSAPRQ